MKVNYYLGDSLTQIGNTMVLSHSAYCSRILKELEIEMANTMSAQMLENRKEFFLVWCQARLSTRKGKRFPTGTW